MKQGIYKSKLCFVWENMRQRCNNSNHPRYADWGGRGITVCAEWKSFKVFREWALANGYEEGLTLERRQNDLGYSPENCVWATRSEQQRNKRDTVKVEFEGRQQALRDVLDRYGIGMETYKDRLRRGWNQQDALTIPVMNLLAKSRPRKIAR